MAATSGPLIAILNSSADLVRVLKTALDDGGFRTVTLVSTTADGAVGPLAFLRLHNPAAAIYSISPPYQEGWEILQQVRRQWQDGRFVITTTNLGALRSCVGPADAIEIIGKPFDLEQITRALRRVLVGRAAGRDGRHRGGAPTDPPMAD